MTFTMMIATLLIDKAYVRWWNCWWQAEIKEKLNDLSLTDDEYQQMELLKWGPFIEW